MPLPFLAQLGIAAAPTVVGGIGRLLRQDKPSSYESRISKIANVLEQDAAAPLTENRFFQEGQHFLEKRSERARDRVTNRTAATGGTQEASLAGTEQINEQEQDALIRLMSGAERFKQRARSRFLNALGLLESAKQARNQQFETDLNRIVQPVQAASQAFLLSDIFEGGEENLPKNTPEATPVGGPATSGSVFDLFDTAGGSQTGFYNPSKFLL